MGDVVEAARSEVPESALQPFLSDSAVDKYVGLIREIIHA